MAELLTFAQARESRELSEVSGFCKDSASFLSLLNQATRKLMTRGNFWGTVERIKFCTYDNCITAPRYVGTVLAVNSCKRHAPVYNNWYSFLPMSAHDFGPGGFCYTGRACSGNLAIENDGTTPVFNNVPCGKAFYVRAYPVAQADLGKVMRIYGIDSNGQEVRTKNADGTWSDGMPLTIAKPYGSTSKRFQTITRVSKPVTQNVIRLYLYDADVDVLHNCALYDPQEQEPNYRHFVIRGQPSLGNCSSQNCGGIKTVEALVKLQFVPVVNDTDIVLISNLDALQQMMLSTRNQTSGDVALAAQLEAAAIRELNLEVNDKFPKAQIPIAIEPCGTAYPVRHGIGRIF